MVCLLFAARGAAAPVASGVFDVRAFGAAGDGIRLDTRAIQDAVEACATGGGGTVRFPPGTYLSGTICLKGGVTLHLEAGATLLGSRNLKDYPSIVPSFRSYTDRYTDKSLLYGENIRHVAIQGPGVIDGQGSAFSGPYHARPYLIRLVECLNVTVRDIRLENAAMWVQHYLACEDVAIERVVVRSRVNHNNDGIDIDGCSRVRISDCRIDTGDDAICLKSTSTRSCRDVEISDCEVTSDCNGLKLGTETHGGFENIRIRRCRVFDTRLAGIALEIVDGGTLDGVVVEDVEMERVGTPLFIRLGDRGRTYLKGEIRPAVGTLRGVSVRNLRATGAGRVGCALTGLPGHPLEQVRLRDVRIAFEGGGTDEDALREVPERGEVYPEYDMFGVLPAYGFTVRHARDVAFERIVLKTDAPDRRPALVLEDVTEHRLEGIEASGLPDGVPQVRFGKGERR